LSSVRGLFNTAVYGLYPERGSNMIMRLRRNQKGFTLLEVMLVVIIIGIIALIALPRLLVTRARARDEACDSNVQAIQTQLEQYYWVNQGAGAWPDTINQLMTDTNYFPVGSDVSSTCVDGTTSLNYTPSNGRLRCPNHSGEPTSWL
jgi:prepilin-type N-terminal cleavage/methylation domain-containing protein